MKNILITVLIITLPLLSSAQSINWAGTQKTADRLAYLNFGYDFGLTTQIGYAHKLKTVKPIWLSLDYSMPMGKSLTDDFKTRIGGQMVLFEKSSFILSTEVRANFRRHENKFVRMASFGSEISGTIGYYKPKWHVAFNLGFDKSIVTHLKHSESLIENYASIQDGWYIPSGGHWNYGLQVSKSLNKRTYVNMDIGNLNAQGKDENALLPIYFNLGLNRMINLDK